MSDLSRRSVLRAGVDVRVDQQLPKHLDHLERRAGSLDQLARTGEQRLGARPIVAITRERVRGQQHA